MDTMIFLGHSDGGSPHSEHSSKLPRAIETQAHRSTPRPVLLVCPWKSLAKDAVSLPRGVKPQISTTEEIGFLIAAEVVIFVDPGTRCTSVLGVPLGARSPSFEALDGEGFLELRDGLGKDKHHSPYWLGCETLFAAPGSDIAPVANDLCSIYSQRIEIDGVNLVEF
ncbi:hypothetical protein BJX64DRAFT_127982 [Aspergillus heterothallicus]